MALPGPGIEMHIVRGNWINLYCPFPAQISFTSLVTNLDSLAEDRNSPPIVMHPAGMRSRSVSHAQHIDYLSLDAELTEMDKRFRNALYQVTFVKVREEFEDDCVQTGAQSSEQGQV